MEQEGGGLKGEGVMKDNKLWGPKWMQRREVKDRKQAFTNNMTYDNYLIRKGQIEQMQMRGNGKMVSDLRQTGHNEKDSR